MTAESALLIPVPAAEPAVGDLRIRYDPSSPLGLPSHITVLYPYLHPDGLSESVVAELGAIFAGVDPFEFTLRTIERFPDVVYLAPDPAEPFVRLTAAVATRWPEAPPYSGRYDTVIPHLTVAHTSRPADIEEIRERVEPMLPLTCEARTVWLMVNIQNQWSILHQFALG